MEQFRLISGVICVGHDYKIEQEAELPKIRVPEQTTPKVKDMSFLSWLYGKGIADAISSDLIKKYLGIKSQHPNEEDGKILQRVWSFWLTLNADKIQAENNEDKIVRLRIIKDKRNAFVSRTLFGLFQDILYIETEIAPADGKIWDSSMKVFVKESAKYGLDFSREYELLKSINDIVK